MIRIEIFVFSCALLSACIGCERSSDADREAQTAKSGGLMPAGSPGFQQHEQFVGNQSEVKIIPARTISDDTLDVFRARNQEAIARRAAGPASAPAEEDTATEASEESQEGEEEDGDDDDEEEDDDEDDEDDEEEDDDDDDEDDDDDDEDDDDDDEDDDDDDEDDE